MIVMSAATLFDGPEVAKQVLLLVLAVATYVVSFENVCGVLVGCHSSVSVDKLPAVKAGIDTLAGEWFSLN